MTEICNVSWPCFNEAHSAVKVYDTTPRFACFADIPHILAKGGEVRPLDKYPGPWIAPSIKKEGEIDLVDTCPVPACKGKVCNGGQK